MRINNSDFDYRKIKTFEDACKKINIDPYKLPDVSFILEKYRKSIIAGYKLRIIYEAINNGWIPDWQNKNQWKYYPWFIVSPTGLTFLRIGTGVDFTHTSIATFLCTDISGKARYIASQFYNEYQEYLLCFNSSKNIEPAFSSIKE